MFSRVRGITADKTNPQFCSQCSEVDFPPREQVITALFCDIRNYTALADRKTPSEIADLLSEYFTYVSRVIINNEGVIEKFVGDAVFSFFNVPMPVERHEATAVQAVMQIRHVVHSMKASGVEVGIGINSGIARVGRLGLAISQAFGAVGDCVNVAARLQGEAKGGEIVMSRAAYEKARDIITQTAPVRECEFKLKGKPQPCQCVVLGI
jgi:class 3 adenylate cyclase